MTRIWDVQCVAGGQPQGLSLQENVVKECVEVRTPCSATHHAFHFSHRGLRSTLGVCHTI